MLKRLLAIPLFICLVLLSQHSIANNSDTSQMMSMSTYRLSVGDMISVTVFGEDDMSLEEARLTDAGTISLPFLGEIKVSGMTVGSLQNHVENELRGDFLVEPNVTVRIIEYRKFFVHGQVRQPGGFSFEPGLTLEKAIALAGGFTERASKREVEVIREDLDGNPTTQSFRLRERILPGDIVNVKESFF